MSTDYPQVTCACSPVYVGMTYSGTRNWKASCPEHGTSSAWYRDPAQAAKREDYRGRTIELARRAREARQLAVEADEPAT